MVRRQRNCRHEQFGIGSSTRSSLCAASATLFNAMSIPELALIRQTVALAPYPPFQEAFRLPSSLLARLVLAFCRAS